MSSTVISAKLRFSEQTEAPIANSDQIPTGIERIDESGTIEPAAGLNLDWERVTKNIAAGDSESFAVFYESFFDVMQFEAKRLTGFDENQCMDIVQDSMLKAIKGMRIVSCHSSLVGWAKTIVKCVVYDRLRKQASRRKRELAYQQQKNTYSETEQVEKNIDDQARIAWIEQQVEGLDSELIRMFDLRYRMGWSLRKIASRFGLKIGAVDGRIRRAVDRIRREANFLDEEEKK